MNPRVIIIGGGFAGLNAAKALKNVPVDVLLLDKVNYHLFQPLLYQVATSALAGSDIASPLRQILASQKNASVILADVVTIKKERKQVIAADGQIFNYDYLILAPGSRHSYFGNPEWEKNAPGLKTLSDAMHIRDKILLGFEKAERFFGTPDSEKYMNFIIVGGGPTGVEVSGAIAEMAHRSLIGNFRKINPKTSKIYLIEGRDQLLPSFPKNLADDAKKDLELLGVDVLLSTLVTRVEENGVWLGNSFIEAGTIIWAAGNEVSPLIKTLNVPLDRFHRVIVNPDLSLVNHPEVFIVGDAACFMQPDGTSLPGIAPVAIQQGRYVAKLIQNKLNGKVTKPFKYVDKGMLATIGKGEAIGVFGNIKISGYTAWLLWCFIHIYYLISFSNRFFVMVQWIYLYIFNKRRIRLISNSIDE